MGSVTPLYAAIIALTFVLLSIRTLRLRRRFAVAIGDGEQPLLARAARAHANFAEYVPITLLLIYFLEVGGVPITWIHALCGTLLVARLVHAYGISQVDENHRYRVTGMALTFTTIISSSLMIVAAPLTS